MSGMLHAMWHVHSHSDGYSVHALSGHRWQAGDLGVAWLMMPRPHRLNKAQIQPCTVLWLVLVPAPDHSQYKCPCIGCLDMWYISVCASSSLHHFLPPYSISWRAHPQFHTNTLRPDLECGSWAAALDLRGSDMLMGMALGSSSPNIMISIGVTNLAMPFIHR